MSARNYQMCTRCVMDTTDPEIVFDEHGVCNHCHEFDEVTSERWFPNEEGERRLGAIVEKIKVVGRNQEYDCILGLSGGVDSSYLALKVKDFGLRPLVVHVDAGWNSELAVYNIEQVVNYCGYELHTHVMDWEEMRDLQVAYLKAGVANQDVPQDHAFFASLYHFSVKNNIKYILSGGNIATEGVFPKAWLHSAMDARNLRAIHRQHGVQPLRQFKTINIAQYYIVYPLLRRMKAIRPLNYMEYDKSVALTLLKETVSYKEYGRKHGESIFTKFYQNYYLPLKFGYDKRKPHLSSMILSGQMTREEALSLLEEPLYELQESNSDMEYVAKKLGFTKDELKRLLEPPGHIYTEYENWDLGYRFLKKAQAVIESGLDRPVKNYS